MQKVLTVLAAAALFSCHSPKQATTSTSSVSQSSKDGWEYLFDGKTTKGWHKFGGGPVGAAWKVSDGALCLDTTVRGGGDIVSDGEFDNFELQVEWKIAKNGNSGIIFYVNENSKYDYPWRTGPEMQVLDNIGAEDNKKGNHLAGTLYDLAGEAASSKPKPVGEWNLAIIRCVNGKLDLTLNNINIVSLMLWDDNWKKMVAGSKFKSMPDFGIYHKGHISLQDHGNGVCYRNIRIKRL